MSALVAWQRSPSVAQLTQALHPSRKDSRHHTGLQTNVTGVSLPCISIVRSVMEFSQVLTDNRWRQKDVVNMGVKPQWWHFENACFVVGLQSWIVAHPAFKSPCAASAEMSTLLTMCQTHRLDHEKTHPASLDLPSWNIIGDISKETQQDWCLALRLQTGS